jgi:hypothetical protein
MELRRSYQDVTDQGARASGVRERAKRISVPVAHEGAPDVRSAPRVAAPIKTSEANTPPESPQAIRASRPGIVSVRSISRWELVRQWLDRWRRSG